MATQPPADVTERVKASYDRIASTYNSWTKSHDKVRAKYLNEFISHLPARAPGAALRILELGCGAGEPATRRLASLPGAEVVANDLSSRQIELARENAKSWGEVSVRFVEGDMSDLSTLDFPAGSLDGVVGLWSIIHLPRDKQAEMFTRIAGWLKVGGVSLFNFGAKSMEAFVDEGWLAEGAWMYWSGWGEGTTGKIEVSGMEIVLQERETEEGAKGQEVEGHIEFLWILARKRIDGGEVPR